MMQKRILKAVLFVLSIGFLFSSCSSDDEWVAGEIKREVFLDSDRNGVFYKMVPFDVNQDIWTEHNAEILDFNFRKGYIEVFSDTYISDVALELIVDGRSIRKLVLGTDVRTLHFMYDDYTIQDFLSLLTEVLYAKGYTDVEIKAYSDRSLAPMDVVFHLDLNVLQRNW